MSRRAPSPSPVPSEPATEAGQTSLGSQIRAARKASGMTLMALAEKTDLSVSYLSQIERDLLTPSVSALKRIAQALEIPAGLLMFSEGRSTFGAGIGVVRRHARKRISLPEADIEYELLTPDLKRRASMLWLSAHAGAESGPAFSHEGEDCVVVIKGVLSVEVGDVWHRLEAGDSIYFNSNLPHRWRNEGPADVEAIWMSTPPSF